MREWLTANKQLRIKISSFTRYPEAGWKTALGLWRSAISLPNMERCFPQVNHVIIIPLQAEFSGDHICRRVWC